MATSSLRVNHLEPSSIKRNAIEEARNVQKLVADICRSNGQEPPPYVLSELIGKGSFGRVYTALPKARPTALVAIKIISIEDGDGSCPGKSDTFHDILHEINTLKLLNESGAKNINIIVDAMLVGQSIWVVTEYCAGGSVATLMRPTNGLEEKWIVPILREVAVALHWVHGQAWRSSTGVAGIIESKFDKRSTVTGTLQWMAPELFDSSVSYGIEVDIWALGSTAFEMAMGLPPNAVLVPDMATFGLFLKQNPPRLEDDRFSADLKDLIRSCMVDNPALRPSIEQIQQHPYLAGTEAKFPTALLANLVHVYKRWESEGGSRLSLFSSGGAQAMPQHDQPFLEGWNFDEGGSDSIVINTELQSVSGAYDSQATLPRQPNGLYKPRCRQPSPNVNNLVVPLERVFNPNTLINYEDNARDFYGGHFPATLSTPTSDLPLRMGTEASSVADLPLSLDTRTLDVRESLIDLDAVWEGDDTTQSSMQDTLRPNDQMGQNRPPTLEWRFPTSIRPVEPMNRWDAEGEDCGTMRLTPGENAGQDRPSTQEWKFPVSANPPPSLDSKDELQSGDPKRSGYQPTTQITTFADADTLRPTSTLSLIDLDAGLFERDSDDGRPSTANSEAMSVSSATGRSAFNLERHLSVMPDNTLGKHPSLYVSSDTGIPDCQLDLSPSNHDWRASIRDPNSKGHSDTLRAQTLPGDSHHALAPPSSVPYYQLNDLKPITDVSMTPLRNSSPDIPAPPSANILLGVCSPEETKDELRRLALSLKEHFQMAADSMNSFAPGQSV